METRSRKTKAPEVTPAKKRGRKSKEAVDEEKIEKPAKKQSKKEEKKNPTLRMNMKFSRKD